VSGTKRTPIGRKASLQISARALQLFEQVERARRRRRAATCEIGVYGQCVMTCAPCRAWLDAHDELHQELGLRPWEYPCLPVCPFPPGSVKAKGWERSGPELELWQRLEIERRRVARGAAADASTAK
jgi:hypothetical protein